MTVLLSQLLQIRHTDRFRLDSYTGQGGYALGQYLWRFPRESDVNFANRLEGTVYYNYVKKIVGIYSGFLWSKEPNREGSDLYVKFQANADGEGGSLNQVLQQAQRLAMLTPAVYLIVDKPNVEAKSRAEEPLPYIVIRKHESLVAYTKGNGGKFKTCVFSEMDDGKTRYRHFFEDGWKVTDDAEGRNVLTDENGQPMQGAYNFGRPPVVALHSTIPLEPCDHFADPWAGDLCQYTWELYNLLSELRWLLRSNTFPLPIFPAADVAAKDYLKDLTVGPNMVLCYDPANGGKPGYMSPPPEPVQMYEARIANLIASIYQTANLEFVTGKADQSGVSTAFYFSQANQTLATMASLDEQADREIAFFAMAWMGQTFNKNIKHPRDFALSDLQMTLNAAMTALGMQIGPEFDKAMKKIAARAALGHGVAQNTMAAIDTEIDGKADPYGDRLAQQAGLK